LHFSVRDTGIGIPADRLDRLFQAFSQVDASTTRKYGGTGLGLAISRRLAELMGGEMWVESEVGKGTTFHFTIEAGEAEALESGRSGLKQGTSAFDTGMGVRHPLRILLAEDNAVNQKVAVRLLERLGYRTDVASNGIEAIESLERQEYDVLFMDVQMPEMDGLEATRRIRGLDPKGLKAIRIIAMTANATEEDRRITLEAGMDDYISKPVRLEELVQVLLRAESRKQE
jgi:CheY-like chemotaxis protein